MHYGSEDHLNCRLLLFALCSCIAAQVKVRVCGRSLLLSRLNGNFVSVSPLKVVCTNMAL